MSFVRHITLPGGIRAAILREIVNGEPRLYLSYVDQTGKPVLVRYRGSE